MKLTNPHEANRVQNGGAKITYAESLKVVNMGLWNDYRRNNECLAKAAAKPLPGASRGAFLNRAIQVGERSIQRITPYIWKVLAAIESPLISVFEQATAENIQSKDGKSEIKIDWKPEQVWEMCFIFSLSSDELESSFESNSATVFKKLAQSEVGKGWDEAEIEPCMVAILEQFKRHISTKVRVVTDMAKDSQITFFQELKKIQTQTASDGSSNMSVPIENTTPQTLAAMSG